MKHKINSYLAIFGVIALVVSTAFAAALPVYAAQTCGEGVGGSCNGGTSAEEFENSVKCEDSGQKECTETTAFSFGACGNSGVGIRCLVTEILRFASVAVGILVVAGITVGGITYSTGRGNPGQVQKGVTIITNSIIGLLLYLLMFGLTNFLIPGGVIR